MRKKKNPEYFCSATGSQMPALITPELQLNKLKDCWSQLPFLQQFCKTLTWWLKALEFHMKLFSSWITTSKPGPEQCTEAMTLLHLGNGAAAAVFSCKSQEKPAGGAEYGPPKKISRIPCQRGLRIPSQTPGAEGGSSRHHHSTLPTSTVCRVMLLRTLRVEPRAAAAPGKHHPAFIASLVCSALRTDPMAAVALHWESTGSRRHGRGLLRTLQNNPTHGKASK